MIKALVVEDEAAESATDRVRFYIPDIKFEFARDPLEAEQKMAKTSYHVLVVDLGIRDRINKFEDDIRSGRVNLLHGDRYLVSGLHTLANRTRYRQPPRTPDDIERRPPAVVVWTIMDRKRSLHVIYAAQRLGVRAFCSKGIEVAAASPSEVKDNLAAAILAALKGEDYNDRFTSMYVKRDPDRPTLVGAFFGQPLWRGIWRALALGIHEESAIRDAIGAEKDARIRERFGKMYESLILFAEALGPEVQAPTVAHRKLIEPFGPVGFGIATTQKVRPKDILVQYAGQNQEFFLDDTVIKQYLPPNHRLAQRK